MRLAQVRWPRDTRGASAALQGAPYVVRLAICDTHGVCAVPWRMLIALSPLKPERPGAHGSTEFGVPVLLVTPPKRAGPGSDENCEQHCDGRGRVPGAVLSRAGPVVFRTGRWNPLHLGPLTPLPPLTSTSPPPTTHNHAFSSRRAATRTWTWLTSSARTIQVPNPARPARVVSSLSAPFASSAAAI